MFDAMKIAQGVAGTSADAAWLLRCGQRWMHAVGP